MSRQTVRSERAAHPAGFAERSARDPVRGLDSARPASPSIGMIKTGPHLKQAREALGWSPAELARALRLAGGDDQGEKRVLEMESGRRPISGPVTVAVEALLHGFLPDGFVRPDL
jgi:hypothetical protein